MKKLAILFIALFSAAALAQDLPKIAVYIASDSAAVREKKTLMTRIQAKFLKSGRYKVIERSGTFLAEIEKEHQKQRTGDIDDSQIIKLGKQYGAEFVCIVDIMASVGTFDVSARIINAETVEIVNIGYCFSPLQTPDDLSNATEELGRQLLGEQSTLAQKPKPETEPTQDTITTTQEPTQTTIYAELPEEQASVLIATLPSLAEIYIGERFIGRSNSGILEIPVGTHEVRFVKDGIDKTTTMTFSSGINPIQYVPLTGKSADLWKPSTVAAASQPKPAASYPSETKSDYQRYKERSDYRGAIYKPINRVSWGVGGFYANNVGGGVEWPNGEQIAMPYSVFGAQIYLDFIYCGIFAGYSAGGGKWESADVSDPSYLPDVSLTYMNFGSFFKIPFGSKSVKFFPLFVFDGELALSAKFKVKDYNYNHERLGLGNPIHLSAMWSKLGGGIDIGLGQVAYLRAETLYGWRTVNSYEEHLYDGRLEPRPGSGLTLKTGIGFKF